RYNDNSRGVAIPNRASASYAVVSSGTYAINNNNDDGGTGAPAPPYGFCELAHSRFDGAFNQNSQYSFAAILDGLSNTAALAGRLNPAPVGERSRYNTGPGSEGSNGPGGWATFPLAPPHAQNGHNLFSGSTAIPFNPVIPDPTSDTRHLCAFSSRHTGGVNF